MGTRGVLSVDVGLSGWGTEHSLKLDIACDYIPSADTGTDARRATVYFKENVLANRDGRGTLDDLEVVYKPSKDMSYTGVFFYLVIKPGYVGCASDNTKCLESGHTATITASGGDRYVPGNDVDGVDAGWKDGYGTNGYMPATKVDLGAVPQLMNDVTDLQSQLAKANTALEAQKNATEAAMAAQKDATEAAMAVMRKEFEDFKSKAMAFMGEVVVEATEPTKCNDCTPTIEADGSDVAINAGGGNVLFTGADCGQQDLCKLAKDVQAVKAKFGQQ